MVKKRVERVAILLTTKEKKELERKAKKLKMPVSVYLRWIALGDGGNEEKKNNNENE